MAAKIFDYDLKSHLEQLEAYFVFDLLHKYL